MYTRLSCCACGHVCSPSAPAGAAAAIARHSPATSSRAARRPRAIVAPQHPLPGSDQLGTARRTFSSSAAVAAAVVEENPLPFPKKSNPSPFEIFHLPRDRNISNKEVKGRYLELVKLYHPDRRAAQGDGGSAKSKGKGKAADDDHEFKAIVAAYELLSDPKRRETYLRTGFGWGGSSRAGFGGGGGGGGPASPWSQSTA